MIQSPTFALIDTASINDCGRLPDSTFPRDLKLLVSKGIAVPFITEHQMEEIAQHGEDAVYLSRMAYLGGLACIASCADSVYGSGLGSILDLREREIRHLLDHPDASHGEIILAIGPDIRGQFHSGPEFVTFTKDGLSEFRKGLHRRFVEHAAEIASMDHFPLVDNDMQLEIGENCDGNFSKENFANWLERNKKALAASIAQFGDRRVLDPETLVEREFATYVNIAEQLANDPRGFIGALCSFFGIQKERLPRKPTIGDAGMEAIFVANLGLHGERMGIEPVTLLEQVRKEQLPSWVIWEGLMRKMRTAAKTTGSNLTDRYLACFGPYVDVLQVDKRTKGFLKELAQGRDITHQDLFQQVFQKVPQKTGLKGLVEAIRQQNPSAPLAPPK